MKREINPQESNRAEAFSMWMSSPMPMVTLVKTLNVSRLTKIRRKTGFKFTPMLCWCIGKAASQVEEFYTLPEKGKLYHFDKLAINVIVSNNRGGLNFCDIPFTDDLQQFHCDYLKLTAQAAKECQNIFLDDYIIVGTSAMIQTELDCIVNQYSNLFNNPIVMWGKYRVGLFKTTLPVSFQFHHVQMDGSHAARFLQYLQDEINKVEYSTCFISTDRQ
jgi:chloramphenicol O-acetyltransferase type A